MALRGWADFINDNRVGPLLRELGDALEDCEDAELIMKATRVAVNMGYSARTMLHERSKKNDK